MRQATVSRGPRRFAAVVAGETVHEIAGRTVDDLIRMGLTHALETGHEALATPGVPLAEVVLELPFQPASVRDFVTFESHVEGVRRSVDGAVGVPEAWYDAPTFYFTNPHALYGPDVAVRRPALCRSRCTPVWPWRPSRRRPGP